MEHRERDCGIVGGGDEHGGKKIAHSELLAAGKTHGALHRIDALRHADDFGKFMVLDDEKRRHELGKARHRALDIMLPTVHALATLGIHHDDPRRRKPCHHLHLHRRRRHIGKREKRSIGHRDICRRNETQKQDRKERTEHLGKSSRKTPRGVSQNRGIQRIQRIQKNIL